MSLLFEHPELMIVQFADAANVPSKLKEYICTHILPVYVQNDKAHQLDHIAYVVRRSLKMMEQFEEMNPAMVFTIAVCHDMAHHIDKDKHEILSALAFENDENMKRFFSEEQRRIIKEAIEDHRASLEYTPRSAYGKIVSSADRSVDIEEFLRRTHAYSLKHFPHYTEAQNMERCYQHMKDKYGEGGYASHYVVDEEYSCFLKTIREMLADRALFETKYKAVNG